MSRPLAIVPATKRLLGLHANAPVQKLSVFEGLHFVFVVLLPLITRLPFSLVRHFILLRWRSHFVEIGRGLPGAMSTLVLSHIFGRTSLAQARLVLGKSTYAKAYSHAVFKGFESWVSITEVKGSVGRWIAPPGTKRSEDDLVLFYIHGGGFTLDTGANCQIFHMHLAKELNLKRGLQYSVYSPDYELAPEFKYPSQLVEILAGYHYLVNECGISENKICIAGDSAGGNLATAFLLHLARPNPAIKVPKQLGPTPKRPAAALIISPEYDLVSVRPSRKANAPYDIIDDGACFRSVLDYVGAPRPRGYRSAPTLDPILLARNFPNDSPAPHFAAQVQNAGPYNVQSEGRGAQLLSSPYVNPSRCEDLKWWKEAMPGEGRTAITWGGKEIFADDDKAMYEVLQKAGVAPTKMYKEFGAHDWIIFECSVDGLAQTKSKGPENDPMYGVGAVADFLSTHFGRSANSAPKKVEGSGLRQRL